MTKTLITLALCHNLPAADSPAAELWLPLIPVGKFGGRDGRHWDNGKPNEVIKNTALPFILDVDHNSETTTNTSASGWVTELKITDDHILGKLELNSQGQEMLADKRYKYYSPAFTTDKNGRVHAFASVALTNKPNLNVPALNNADVGTGRDLSLPDNPESLTKGELIMLAALLAALGLAADADQQTALNTISTLKQQSAEGERSRTPDLNAFVPKATHDQVVVELNAVKKQLADKAQADHSAAVEVAINAAIADKKIAPADKDFYLSCCASEKGLEDFRQFVANKAAVIGDVALPDNPPTGGETALNSEQKDLLSQLGLSEADFIQQSKLGAGINDKTETA